MNGKSFTSSDTPSFGSPFGPMNHDKRRHHILKTHSSQTLIITLLAQLKAHDRIQMHKNMRNFTHFQKDAEHHIQGGWGKLRNGCESEPRKIRYRTFTTKSTSVVLKNWRGENELRKNRQFTKVNNFQYYETRIFRKSWIFLLKKKDKINHFLN